MEEAGTWAEYQKLVLKLLEQHTNSIESLHRQYYDIQMQGSKMESKLQEVATAVTELTKIVKDGDDGSMIARLKAVEEEIAETKKEKDERRKHGKAVWTSVGISILGFVFNIVMYVIGAK
jgi:C4-type Zn-finger protein